jgi:hypothetical protein
MQPFSACCASSAEAARLLFGQPHAYPDDSVEVLRERCQVKVYQLAGLQRALGVSSTLIGMHARAQAQQTSSRAYACVEASAK